MKASKFLGLLAALLLLVTLAVPTLAEETEAAEEAATEETVEVASETKAPVSRETSGTCGDGLSWELSGSTLTISGSGEMNDGSPWAGHKERVKTVILSGGVTKVGAGAFDGFENLTAVNFGDSLKEVGEGAFRGCTALKEISLPATFRLFGVESFYGSGLEAVYCGGGMPSFKGSCLWNGNHIMVYYPVNNPWPQESVQILTDNFGGRLEVVPFTSDAPQPKAVVVEETVPPTTVPATEPETLPTLPPETRPVVTEAPAVPETEAEVETEATEAVVYTLPTMATQPVEKPENKGGISGGMIGVLLVVGVLTFFIVGALIARSVSRRKYYD